jgi:ATP-dependent DNA helicase RecG
VSQAAGVPDMVAAILATEEGPRFETKRVSGKMVHKALETVCAFANTEGGVLALGVEDADKAGKTERLFGVDENPVALDELQRKLPTQLTPPVEDIRFTPVPCALRDGQPGTLVLVRVPKSAKVHSVVEGGTWRRMGKSNRQMSATEIATLSFTRGLVSAESALVEVPLELLDTEAWRIYCASRALRSGDIGDRLFRLGLAKRRDGELLPTRAAVLLFADDPSGVLAAKAAIRVFHYTGNRVEHGPVPNLRKTPKTITGPLIRQVADAYAYVAGEIAQGLTLAASGFETVHRYPARVIREAITNAVIHRDYRLNRDIQIRIFDNRIEIESPGLFPGIITPSNVGKIGSFARNPLVARNLREFPEPPNVDAGEGVRMMFAEMRAANLYPPFYSENRDAAQPSVIVTLRNEERPPIWEQVSDWMDRNGALANSDLCQIAAVDTLKASKMLKRWVEQGVLLRDDSGGKRHTVYRKPVPGGAVEPPPSLSLPLDNGDG